LVKRLCPDNQNATSIAGGVKAFVAGLWFYDVCP
jgi:hypothetical protein